MPGSNTIDWSTVSENGNYTVGSGDAAMGVTISTTTNGDAQSAAVSDQGSPSEEGLWVNDLTSAVVTEVTFDAPVQNVSFEIFDLDQNGTDWDERITILATDAEGNVFPVSYSDLAISHTTSGNTIDAEGISDTGTNTSGAEDSVTATIAGPILSLEIIFEPGEDAAQTGALGISDITFDAAPDGIVEGGGAADKIDQYYTDDPEGDMVSDGDDVVEAGAGDDSIYTGDGDDHVSGGDGNDIAELGAGNDTFIGGEGDDSVNGDLGDDVLHGGTGNDFLRGSYGNDTIYSGGHGDGDDYLWGGYGDDRFIIEDGFGNDTIAAENQDEVDGDTLDLSAVTSDLAIDLSGGAKGVGSLTDGTDTLTYDAIENIVLSSGQDTLLLADGSGSDSVIDFALPIDNGDGSFTAQDMLDVSGMTSDYGSTPVTTRDVTISEDADGNAVLTFPGGESLTLVGVSADDLSDPAVLEAIGIPAAPDGYITGTDSDDVMTAGYTDADGDVIDDDDAALPGASGDDDHILAMGGNDLVFSGAGNDIVEAGSGNDTIFAATGDDTLIAGSGDNVLYGEDGNDVFYAGTGSDSMEGGAGNDQFHDIGAGDTVVGGDGTDTINMEGAGPYSVTYNGADPTSGQIQFLDGSGNVTGTAHFSGIETIVPCFTPGTLIETIDGPRAVEALKVGDQIKTRDHGLRPIRWIGRRDVTSLELQQAPHWRAICIRKGSLGQGCPAQDMRLSPNHRLMITDPRADLLFGEAEVLVAAKHLVGREGISRDAATTVSYVHIMFDQHEIVQSDGIWTESFRPGQQALAGMDTAQQEEIFALFPELRSHPDQAFPTARRIATRQEAKLFLK
ncbi:Hint domain-containing protein [Cognatishimia maritima]|uniref:Ca2+-binding protein, RTX toxin-related n=1 Tax=Cognatishimia maritima TaxID=870908 RepID=A0A1M5I2W3_9RHOB|nr:Hint domain-containing protein [Cognatishimia maritima]SHG22606.1 Ca2+-binding protein, RTX toxin-related [Cognatishimia maritima]